MVVPSAMPGLVGVTWIETSVAAVTVSVVFPETRPDDALIVVEPAATDVARPFDPDALLTAATPGDDELQVTEEVRSWLELSE